MKVKIRITNDYEDLDEPIVVEKWIDAAIPGTRTSEEWAEEWLLAETGTGRYAGVCRHCGEETVMVNAAPDNEPARFRPFHKSEHELPGYRSACISADPLERTPDAYYVVQVLECEEMPFLVNQRFEWGG